MRLRSRNKAAPPKRNRETPPRPTLQVAPLENQNSPAQRVLLHSFAEPSPSPSPWVQPLHVAGALGQTDRRPPLVGHNGNGSYTAAHRTHDTLSPQSQVCQNRFVQKCTSPAKGRCQCKLEAGFWPVLRPSSSATPRPDLISEGCPSKDDPANLEGRGPQNLDGGIDFEGRPEPFGVARPEPFGVARPEHPPKAGCKFPLGTAIHRFALPPNGWQR
jgi:hypothetical protein